MVTCAAGDVTTRDSEGAVTSGQAGVLTRAAPSPPPPCPSRWPASPRGGQGGRSSGAGMVAELRWPRVQPEAAAGLVVELGGGPGSARPGLCPHGVVASCGPSPCTPSPCTLSPCTTSPCTPSPCTPNSFHARLPAPRLCTPVFLNPNSLHPRVPEPQLPTPVSQHPCHPETLSLCTSTPCTPSSYTPSPCTPVFLHPRLPAPPSPCTPCGWRAGVPGLGVPGPAARPHTPRARSAPP